jgi:2-oxo-4-hydroxy-4-carboxy--5-ureidoimidazoline (OHCU) decarboxylase
LNEAYRARFGFPLIMSVRGRRLEEILAAFGSRLGRGAPEEEAPRQVERILPLRLRDRFAAG